MPRRPIALLAAYLRPLRGRVALLAALILAGIGLDLLSPQIVRAFIDAATAGAPADALTRAALLFMAVALVTQAIAVAVTYLGQSVGWAATNALRADLAEHCLRLDMSFHKARTPGELIERVDGDVTNLTSLFSQLTLSIIGNALLMLGVIALLWRESPWVGAAMAAFAAVAMAVLFALRSVAVPFWARVRQADAEFYGFLGEQLAGTEDVRANGATGYVMWRLHSSLRAWLPLQRRAGLAGYTIWNSTILLFSLGNALAFALGAWLYGAGQISIGTVFLIFNYTELLRRPIEQIRAQLQELQKAAASVGRVQELLAISSRLPDGAAPLPAGPLAVEICGVGFAYEDGGQGAGSREPEAGIHTSAGEHSERSGPGLRQAGMASDRPPAPVLSDLSLSLAPGQVLGLLGRTGSGKTSLARLLLRLYDPTSGAVRVGGVDLREAEAGELRRRVGMVTQDVQLFSASVRENLTLFRPGISDAQILAALDGLGLAPWLGRLPAGLDSPLTPDGLSSGEAQLLAFARLFLADPGLVVLDEASSRLDPATEALLERAVGRLLAGRTGVIIAHRLATVQRADSIAILEAGRVVEHGPRAALAADPHSRFARLLREGLEEVLA